MVYSDAIYIQTGLKRLSETLEAIRILFKIVKVRWIVLALTSLLILTVTSPAWAVPAGLTEKQSRSREVKAEIDQIDDNLGLVVEEYNQARLILGNTQAQIATNNRKLAKARRNLARSTTILASRVESIYRHGRIGIIEVLFDAKSFDEFLLRLDLLCRIGRQDAQILRRVEVSKREIEKRKEELARQEKKQKATFAQIKTKKNRIESEIRRRDTLLAGIRGEIAQLERKEAARQAALRRSYDHYAYRPSRGSHSGVVSVAMAQLGKPYRYGAAGPGAFDCSGLVMYCYARVGVRLPHSSSAQYGCGAPVSRSELSPGDLVFFYSPIHHVGIYVGGGNFIHAPHTGARVRVESLSSHRSYVGACRP